MDQNKLLEEIKDNMLNKLENIYESQKDLYSIEEMEVIKEKIEKIEKENWNDELKESIKNINSYIKNETYISIFNRLLELDICPSCGNKLNYIIKEKEDIDDLNELIRNHVSFVTDYMLVNIFLKNKKEKPFYICYKCKDIYNNRFININKYYEDYWDDYEEMQNMLKQDRYGVKKITASDILKRIDKYLKY